MTPDYGAPSQLEKIDMLDLADLVVLNKSDRRGAEDALRDVRKQWRRNHAAAGAPDAEVPVFADHRARAGTTRASTASTRRSRARLGETPRARAPRPAAAAGARRRARPGARGALPRRDRRAPCAPTTRAPSSSPSARATPAAARARCGSALGRAAGGPERRSLEARARAPSPSSAPSCARELEGWPALRDALPRRGARSTGCAGARTASRTTARSLSGSRIPKVALPARRRLGRAACASSAARTCPGASRSPRASSRSSARSEDPTRMFAGEGGPERTNRRFHLLCQGQTAVRLSTAFDSVTLYGRDPGRAPRRLRQGRQLRRLGLHASTTPRSSTRASTCARRARRSR